MASIIFLIQFRTYIISEFICIFNITNVIILASGYTHNWLYIFIINGVNDLLFICKLYHIFAMKNLQIFFFLHDFAITNQSGCICLRRVWRYQRGNQNPYIEEEQTTHWPKEKVQKDKQRSTKHTYKTKDRVTQTQLKTGGKFKCSGRVGSSCSTSDIRRVNLATNPFYVGLYKHNDLYQQTNDVDLYLQENILKVDQKQISSMLIGGSRQNDEVL
jgi:hypothetical protein